MLDNAPIPLSLEKDNDPRLVTSPLKFPGKLAIDVLNNRLFISDSNHNRIVGSLCLLCSFYNYFFFRRRGLGVGVGRRRFGKIRSYIDVWRS